MYSLINHVGVRFFLRKEAFPIAISLLCTELFLKFGSFLLEGAAFLLMWFFVGKVLSYFQHK